MAEAAQAQNPPAPTPPEKTMADIAKKAKPNPDVLFVTDQSATPANSERVHTLLIDEREVNFTFQYGKELEVPREIGLKFLKNEGFVVRDGAGNKIDRIPEQPDPFLNPKPFVLGQDQVVANFSELSDESLQTRCNMELGGERFKRGAPRKAMIGFLLDLRKKRDAERNKKVKGVDGDPDGWTPPEFGPNE